MLKHLTKYKHFFPVVVALVCAGIFALLLARNPFSQRTLIPNFEPYPDSFHYLVPPLNLLQGKGFSISRLGIPITPSVPPLYSAVMLPLFVVLQDPRMSYFTNVILSFVSLLLLYKIVRRFSDHPLVVFSVLFFFVTNFLMYWFPSLVMAENLLLPLFLTSIYVLILPYTRTRAVIAAVLSIAFYATKYAAIPLTAVFAGMYALKIISRENSSDKKKELLIYFLCGVFIGTAYLGYEYLVKGNNIVGTLYSSLLAFAFPPPPSDALGKGASSGIFFSLSYASRNIRLYSGWLFGQGMPILWHYKSIFPTFIAIPAMLGLGLGMLKQKTRWISIYAFTSFIGSIAFLMIFYVADGRYLLFAVPSLCLGFGLFIHFLTRTGFHTRKPWLALVMFLLLFIPASKALYAPLKLQAVLNLRYAETPWYYLSILHLDDFVQGLPESDKQPVIISTLPPYLVDFYTTKQLLLLPLDKAQEFRGAVRQTWGDIDIENLHTHYTKYLSNGHRVFFDKYGLGNEAPMHAAYKRLQQAFTLTKVSQGCFTECDIYELSLKK